MVAPRGTKARRSDSCSTGGPQVVVPRGTAPEWTRQGLVSYGFPYEIPTGGEVARALAHADDYMAKRGLYESAEGELDSPEDLE